MACKGSGVRSSSAPPILKVILNPKKILLLVILLHLVNNAIWFGMDGSMNPGCHAVWIEENAFKAQRVFLGKAALLNKAVHIARLFSFHPGAEVFDPTGFNLTSLGLSLPLVPEMSGEARLFLNRSWLFIQFLVFLGSVYFLSQELFGSTAGAWSAILLSFYPGVFGLSRKTNSMLLVASFVAFACVVLLRWQGMRPLRRCLLFSLVSFLGLCSGQIFLVFLLPLLFIHLFVIARSEDTYAKLQDYAFLALAAGTIVFFYSRGDLNSLSADLAAGFRDVCSRFPAKAQDWIGSAADGRVSLYLYSSQDFSCPCTQTVNTGLNLKTLFFYPAELLVYLSFPFFLLALVSLVLFFGDKGVGLLPKVLFSGCMLFGYATLTAVYLKWGRFVVPLAGLLAVTSGYAVCRLSGKLKAVKSLLVIAGISTVINYSYFEGIKKAPHESLSESMVSHRPAGPSLPLAAGRIASLIENRPAGDSLPPRIIFIDSGSARFGTGWYADITMQLKNMVVLYLKRQPITLMIWRLEPEFAARLPKQCWLVVISDKPITDAAGYLGLPKAQAPAVKTLFCEELERAYIHLIEIGGTFFPAPPAP